MRKTAFWDFLHSTKAALSRVPRVVLLPLSAILMALCLLFPRIGALQWIAMVPLLFYLFDCAVLLSITSWYPPSTILVADTSVSFAFF